MGPRDFTGNQQGGKKEKETVLLHKTVLSPHSPLPCAIMVEQNDSRYSLG